MFASGPFSIEPSQWPIVVLVGITAIITGLIMRRDNATIEKEFKAEQKRISTMIADDANFRAYAGDAITSLEYRMTILEEQCNGPGSVESTMESVGE